LLLLLLLLLLRLRLRLRLRRRWRRLLLLLLLLLMLLLRLRLRLRRRWRRLLLLLLLLLMLLLRLRLRLRRRWRRLPLILLLQLTTSLFMIISSLAFANAHLLVSRHHSIDQGIESASSPLVTVRHSTPVRDERVPSSSIHCRDPEFHEPSSKRDSEWPNESIAWLGGRDRRAARRDAHCFGESCQHALEVFPIQHFASSFEGDNDWMDCLECGEQGGRKPVAAAR